MEYFRQRYFGLLFLLFGCGLIVPGDADAQLFDRKKLPNIFNRDRNDETGQRGPGSRGGSEITFVRDFGIPKPRPVKLETLKGHEVIFFISAETKTPGMTVEFLVRDHPSAGKLNGLISNPDNRSSAKVIYYADPDSAATMDSFSFAARYPGGKYSSVVRCDIKINDAQAKIVVSPAADFGKLLIGEKGEREIQIQNQGNLTYNRTIQMFAPWKLMYPPDGKISLTPGTQTKIKVSFQPVIAGPASYDLALSRGDQGTCKLKGEAVVPFAVAESEWELKYNPTTERREAEVVVRNNTERPFEVFLRTSSRLQTFSEKYTVLIPGKDNNILVNLAKDDVAAFDGGLELKLKNGYSQITNIFCNTQPAEIKIEIPNQLGQDVINFGKLTAGRSTERGIVLKNNGGELLAFEASVPEPFRLLTRIDRQLAPLGKMPVSIGFYPGESDRGGADQFAVFKSATQEIKIRLVGNALRPANAPRDPPPAKIRPAKTNTPDPDLIRPPQAPTVSPNLVPNSPPRVGSGRSQPKSMVAVRDEIRGEDLSMSPFGALTRTLLQRELAPGLKSPEDFELLGAKAHRIELGWTAPKDSELDNFAVEMRGERINPVTEMIESVWAPYDLVEYERVGRLVKATVGGLLPVTKYEFRVFTVDSNGRSSPASMAFGTQTGRTMDWTYIYIGLGLLLFAALILAIIKIIKDRRGEVYQSEYA